MLNSLYLRVKNVFVAFVRMSFTQSSIILLNAINGMLKKGVYFIAFYWVFLYDPLASFKTNISMTLLIGIAVGIWALIINTLKDQMMMYVTPLKGSIFRGLYDIRYIILIAGMFFWFNLKYSQSDFFWYVGIVGISVFLSRVIEGTKIKLLDKDWFKYENERK